MLCPGKCKAPRVYLLPYGAGERAAPVLHAPTPAVPSLESGAASLVCWMKRGHATRETGDSIVETITLGQCVQGRGISFITV